MIRRTRHRPSSPQAETVSGGEPPFAAGPVRDSGAPERLGTAVNLHSLGDEYLTLAQLEAYSKISGRQLRNYLALPPGQALPCYRPGRKVLVRRSEFDTWLARYRQRGKPILTRVLRELGLDPERLPDTRPPSALHGSATRGRAR